MDATDLIRKIQDFFEKNYYAELLEKIRKNEKFIHIDFSKLSSFDPEVADLLLDNPEEVIKAAELAIEQIDSKNGKGFAMRVINLPESSRIMIRNIRSKHLGRFLFTEGVVRQKSDVRPQVTAARFECPSCGNAISVLQLDNKFKEPTRCSCGRKGRFKLLEKSLVDAQMLVLEEVPEQLEGGVQPKRVNVFLKNDLVSPLSERKTNPGSRIVIAGSIKEIPIFTRSGSQSTRFDILFESNSVFAVEEDFSDIKINKKEKEAIEALVSDEKNLMKKLIGSIVPSIYGHEKIKEALLLQMVGGVRKVRDDGGITRGDIHILLVGDPGGGKSQMLKRIGNVAPKGRFVSGKGVSGAGLTATVVKDEFLQGWSLEAGALVLANKGVICIDELDKMSQDDRSAMHEALEGQTITISKANIQATLRCETTVLAAANPKFGRFDPYDTVARQINLPPALINRFDLIFPIKDLPDAAKDEKLAKFILNLHQNDLADPDVDTRLLRKFLVYARQNVFPKLTDSAVEELKNYFIKMRGSGGDMRSVPISARQLEGLVRLSEAYARLRLKSKVSKKDAQKAIEILDYCLRQVALDEETGTIDIDRIATSVPASQRNKIIQIKEIISDLENKLGKTIPLEDVVSAASEKGISEAEAEEMIQKLKRSGDIFEPRRGFISKL
ncbi:minichromosome maintenance protein MCM [Candidatus Woesearchaeota archaeon]|nr:minichromosome maintenance protein MCM [Candidatus Woesearchaeota archaeon]MBW3006048.1 minichromosome maintenance protein MCM [Candidatus Woesearchaeota archaeon]